MSHRDQLHNFDSAVAQLRAGIQDNTHSVEITRVDGATVIRVVPRPPPSLNALAPEPSAGEPGTTG